MAFAMLDTHAVVKQLTAAGFTGEQAEAAADVVRRTQDVDLSNLATKADLADVRALIAETKAEILKWMVGTIGLQTAVILGTVVALLRLSPR